MTLSGNGTVSLGSGNLTTNDLISAFRGGSLSVANQYVGNGGMGTFTQSGGNNSIAYNGSLYLGYNAADSGRYNLNGSGQLSAPYEYVGSSGTGTFTQSGGNNSIAYYGSLYLGYNAGSSGTYNLSGSGQLSVPPYEYVGYSGSGTFTQSGGSNTINGYYSSLYLGYNVGSSGTYSLGGNSQLLVPSEYVGYSGTGTFAQSGGTHSIANSLYLGYNAGSGGTYNLSGSGQLSAASEYVGCDPGAAALFQQTSGSNATSFISIGSGGRYLLSGGTLNITGSGGISNQGAIDFTNSEATLTIGSSCIVDLSQATLTNVTAMTVNMGANSLLIVPAGFNPSAGFAQYSSLGLTHTLGTTLTVPAGQGFGGLGSITDPVNCQGTIMAASGSTINLSGGLMLSGTGVVDLGNGNLTTNDLLSDISGGSLYVANHYVGNGGTGTFTQTGGNNNVGYYGYGSLYLGNSGGDSGTYNLSGSGQLSAYGEYVGNSGTGIFTQSGGKNGVSYGNLCLGYNAGGSGTYNLSGSGLLSANTEYVGYSGTGTFTQSGGTHTIANALYLGNNADSSGTYNLTGSGQVSANYGYVGNSGTGTFTQNGGTHTIANALYLGNNAGSSGTYNLSGSGLLSANTEYVGYSGTGAFTQNGGTNTVSGLSIGSGGTYLLAGGALQINGTLVNQGIFAGNGTPAMLSDNNNILDLSSGTWQNLGAISVSMGANSLLIVPAGFDTSTDFAHYSSLGLTHTLGTTLTVLAGQ
ncbi:MAG: beta strand repeat-containing protein, partial [Thermoguttaceae bacterium]